MPWDPAQYLAFQTERTRPALDLLTQVPLAVPRQVVDLGCGAGNVTRVLRSRWPGAAILGVDTSTAMLATASEACLDVHWTQADLAAWVPEAPVDLIFSNASLHWVDDHEHLFPRLLSFLAPGGYLAVQMPRNHDRPSHTAVFDLIQRHPGWRERLGPRLRRDPVASLEAYRALLSPLATRVEAWETDYLHLLEGADAAFRWIRGSFLAPLLEALEPEDQEGFLSACRSALAAAYPQDGSGRTAFRFRRLFLVARR